MTAHTPSTTGRTRPVWCDDCKRPHDGTESDARMMLGARGSRVGYAYAFCSREDAYHLASERATLPIRTAPTRIRWTNGTPTRITSSVRNVKDVDTGKPVQGARIARGSTRTTRVAPSFLRAYVRTGSALHGHIVTEGAGI